MNGKEFLCSGALNCSYKGVSDAGWSCCYDLYCDFKAPRDSRIFPAEVIKEMKKEARSRRENGKT